MAGGIFVKKEARLRWLGTYFSRKKLDCDVLAEFTLPARVDYGDMAQHRHQAYAAPAMRMQ